MPRLTNQNPKYRKHRASGQALVSLNGKDFYLGAYGTKASRAEYDRLISEWLANGRRRQLPDQDLFVAELAEVYWEYCKGYHGGDASQGELGSIKLAIALLRKLFGAVLVEDFGPLKLKAARNEMIGKGWSRHYINSQIGRIRRMFKWGVANEKVSAAVFQSLQAVEGLRQGKTEARETNRVRPAHETHVDAVEDHVSRQVWAMIELQLLTGMRPGEVCIMRGRDIDTTGKLWAYRPARHKTQSHGYERVIHIGPRAQKVLAPGKGNGFLKPDLAAYLFSPADADAERRALLSEKRGTPDNCGNAPGSNRKRKPRRSPGDRYDVDAYRRAIERGCDAAFPPASHLARAKVPAAGRKTKAFRWETRKEWRARLGDKQWAELQAWQRAHRWHPHQLRHNAATRLRKEYGLEAAQVILGHQTLAVTEIYAEKNVAAAMKIMSEVG
jgi:integrase